MASLTSKLTIFSNGDLTREVENPTSIIKDVGLSVPLDGNFYRVMHDWELPEFDYKPRQYDPAYEQMKPMPSTRMMWDCKPSDFVPLSSEWQFWIYDLLDWASGGQLPKGEIEYYYTIERGVVVKSSPSNPYARVKCTYGSLLWVWEDLTANHRAFTDGHAPDSGFADYVIGRNLSAKPMSWKSLHNTGNIVKVIGSSGQYKVLETLDMSKPPPELQWVVENKPWLIGWATEQSVYELPRVGNKRSWTVAKFPQLKLACRAHGLPEVGTPFPVVGKYQTNTMLSSHLEMVARGSHYSPYVPEK